VSDLGCVNGAVNKSKSHLEDGWVKKIKISCKNVKNRLGSEQRVCVTKRQEIIDWTKTEVQRVDLNICSPLHFLPSKSLS
jgi:hypothetical protein